MIELLQHNCFRNRVHITSTLNDQMYFVRFEFPNIHLQFNKLNILLEYNLAVHFAMLIEKYCYLPLAINVTIQILCTKHFGMFMIRRFFFKFL